MSNKLGSKLGNTEAESGSSIWNYRPRFTIWIFKNLEKGYFQVQMNKFTLLRAMNSRFSMNDTSMELRWIVERKQVNPSLEFATEFASAMLV